MQTKDEPINIRRTFDMSLIRACVLAPFISLYFPWLARTFPGTTYKAALTRVAADQAVGSPISIVLTFASAGILQGRPGTILERLREQAAPAWRNGVSYWPFVHFFNFLLVPVHHQPLVAHAASLWWNAVLSHRSFVKLKSEEAQPMSDASPVVMDAQLRAPS